MVKRKRTHEKAIRALDRVASHTANLPVKRMMGTLEQHDPRPPKRGRASHGDVGGLGRFSPGRADVALMNRDAAKHLKEIDPRAEWEYGVRELRDEWRAIRARAPSAAAAEGTKRGSTSRRRRSR